MNFNRCTTALTLAWLAGSALLGAELPEAKPEPAGAVPPGGQRVSPDPQHAETQAEAQRRERPRTLAAAREYQRQRDELHPPAPTGRALPALESYDAALVARVQEHWHQLVQRASLLPRSGKVEVHFQLLEDGQIDGLSIANSEVGSTYALLCQRAVREAGPFAAWPAEVRRAIADARRPVLLAFHHHGGEGRVDAANPVDPRRQLAANLWYPRLTSAHTPGPRPRGEPESAVGDGFHGLPGFLWPSWDGGYAGSYSPSDSRKAFERAFQQFQNGSPRSCPPMNPMPSK